MLIVIGCGQFASFLSGEQANYLEIENSDYPGKTNRIPVTEEHLAELISLSIDNGPTGSNGKSHAESEDEKLHEKEMARAYEQSLSSRFFPTSFPYKFYSRTHQTKKLF